MQAILKQPWEPFPNSSQRDALLVRADHILFEGSRGPGKTDTQLMRFRRRVGLGYGSFWKGIILDREYKNLADIIGKSKRWFRTYDDGARFLEGTSALKWVWPTGEELLFRQAKREDDYWNYHGHEYPYIGWNELTKYATPALYNKMMSTNRSSFVPEIDTPDIPLKGLMRMVDPKTGEEKVVEYWIHNKALGLYLEPIPLEVFSTANPYGPGHNWVKRRFITPAPAGEFVDKETEVFDPQTQTEIIVRKRQIRIHGSWRENRKLSAGYIAELMANTNEAERKAWLNGDWNIVAGGALDDVWTPNRHVIPRFRVPESWRVDRAFDWGSSHPFSVGWFAEANGEEATLEDGTTFCPSKGSLILIKEWYGAKEIGNNVGLKMSASDIAEGIRDREIDMMHEGWIARKPYPGPADNQIRDVRESDVETIESKMRKIGVTWERSDKSPGSRKNGLQLFRDRLEASKRGSEAPGFYVTQNCRAFIDTVPVLPRDEDNLDDVDTEAEDHCYDMARYRVLKGANRLAKKLKFGIGPNG